MLLVAVRRLKLHVVLAMLLTVGGVIGAQFGARAGRHVKAEELRALLAAMVLAVCLIAEEETMYSGFIHLQCEFNSVNVVVRSRGGTVKIRHEPSGGVDFGMIACNHLYTRKISFFNDGSSRPDTKLSWVFI